MPSEVLGMHRARIERIHHLTLEVPNLERALEFWRDALGVSPDIRWVPDRETREAAFPVGELEIRLRERTGVSDGDGVSLAQLGLQVTSVEAAVDACRAVGVQAAKPPPAPTGVGRRSRLVDLTGHTPALELVEASLSMMELSSERVARSTARAARLNAPTPRGKVRRGGKKG